jgi:hypothetical protein
MEELRPSAGEQCWASLFRYHPIPHRINYPPFVENAKSGAPTVLVVSARSRRLGHPASIAAHPFDKLRAGSCKKPKDGAPSAGMVQCKDGPPAPSPLCISCYYISACA